MIRRSLAALVFIVFAAALTFDGALNAWQADAIITLERGALDRWVNADPGGYLALYANDVSYFDPARERRVDGLAAMTKLLEPIRGAFKAGSYEMIGPRVQRSGTMAVLTYNLASRATGPDGKPMTGRWNSTAVYTQVEGRWKIVHSHWSFTQPALKAP